MSIGFAPGVEIYREFAAQSTAIPTRQPAYIFGPAADVYPYVAGANNLGKLGQYDPTPDTDVDGTLWNVFAYPERRTGGVVDQDTLGLHVTNGLFQYFSDTTNTAVKKSRNTINLPSFNLQTKNGFTVAAGIGSRQVQVGDIVQVRATLTDASTYVLNSYVTSLIANVVASAVGNATAGPANNNNTAAASIVGGNNAGISTVVDATGYNGTKAGRTHEIYTVTALNTTADNSVTGARFSVTSADGRDNLADVTEVAGEIPLGARGATITFTADGPGTNIEAGDVWTIQLDGNYTQVTATSAGTYTGPTDEVYIIEIAEGGTFAQVPKIRITTQSGNDQLGLFTLTESGAAGTSHSFAVGSYGITATLTGPTGFVTGERFTIEATAASEGAVRTIALAHSLPANLAADSSGANISVDFMVRRNVTLSRTAGAVEQWRSRSNDVLIAAGLSVSFTDITNLDGSVKALPLNAPAASTSDSQLELSYRVWHPASTGLQSLSADGSISAAIAGPTSVDNPLKLALNFAQAEAAGAPVYWYCTGDPSVQVHWEQALKIVEQTRAVYGLVPVTQDATILSLVHAHCVSRSTPLLKLHRVCWLSPLVDEVVELPGLVDNPTATITDDPNTAGNQYTLVEFTIGHMDLLAQGVRAGDEVRYNYVIDASGDTVYSTAIVDTVINSDSLLLTTSIGAAEPVPKKMTIHRTRVDGELVTAMQQAAAPFDVKARVLAPSFLVGTTETPGYVMCAAMAARRSSYRPHQPMTNTDVTGVTSLIWENKFVAEELNLIATAGIFLFKQDPVTNVVSVRHAITAGDYDNILLREESVQSNADDLVFRVDDRLKPLYGKLNANDESISAIQTELDSLQSVLLSEGSNSRFGAQIIEFDTSRVRISPISKDTILVDVLAEVPGPANLIQVFMFVS